MVHQGYKELLVELEHILQEERHVRTIHRREKDTHLKLMVYLVYTVDELHKDGRALGGLKESLVAMPTAAAELMSCRRVRVVRIVNDRRGDVFTKCQPFFLDEDLEPFDGPVVWIEDDLRQRAQLARSVPSVAAMHQYRRSLLQKLGDAYCCLQHQTVGRSYVRKPRRRKKKKKNEPCVFQPAFALEQPALSIQREEPAVVHFLSADFRDLSEAVPHGVDVVDIHEV
jgi:hypothetical protein